MSEETFNPFDAGGYAPEGKVQQSEPTQEPTQQQTEQKTETQETSISEPVQSNETQVLSKDDRNTSVTVDAPAQEEVVQDNEFFQWNDDFSKTIYDKLVNKEVSDLADILYEQKVLSSLDSMSDEDIVKLSMAYEYPDLTPEEIEDEFNSKFNIDDEIDEELLTEEEISAKRKQIEKQTKAVTRELKKLARNAKDSLQELKRDIDFPDILSQLASKQQPISEDVISEYLTKQDEEQQAAYLEARRMFESSIDEGLKAFDGFGVNYKDEDVQFDGKFNLTQEDKVALQESLLNFDLESFYGNRYYKDGRYDTKQLAEDVYFLQNRDKIVSAMVTQAVSKAKADLLKGMKNIDYSNQPRTSTSANMSDYDEMVNTMFRL